jgi:hypothetical protein
MAGAPGGAAAIRSRSASASPKDGEHQAVGTVLVLTTALAAIRQRPKSIAPVSTRSYVYLKIWP